MSYIIRYLSEIGYEVHLAFLYGGPNLALIDSNKVTLHCLVDREDRELGVLRLRNYDPLLLFRIAKLVRTLQPDICHTWTPQMDIVGGMACWLTGTPWVLREAASELLYRRGMKTALRTFVGRRSTAIVANSEAGARYWKVNKQAKEPHVIRNGIPLTEIKNSPVTSCYELKDTHAKTVLYAGRFDAQKNIWNMISAFSRVVSSPAVRVILCGEGPFKKAAEQLINQDGLAARITITGYKHNLWSIIKSADVFVSVANFEGCPNTVLEAMTCGCPLVLSDIPEHRELLEPGAAMFVNRNDPAEIADAINTLLCHPEEARMMAAKASRIAERFSVACMAQQYEQLYSQLLQEKTATRLLANNGK